MYATQRASRIPQPPSRPRLLDMLCAVARGDDGILLIVSVHPPYRPILRTKTDLSQLMHRITLSSFQHAPQNLQGERGILYEASLHFSPP